MVADALAGVGPAVRALRMQNLTAEADTAEAPLACFEEAAALGDVCASLRVTGRLVHGEANDLIAKHSASPPARSRR